MLSATRDERVILLAHYEKKISVFEETHKRAWRDFFIGKYAQCNGRSSRSFFAHVGCTAGSISMLYDKDGNEQNSDKGILKICEYFHHKLFQNEEIFQCDDASTQPYDGPQEWSFNDSTSIVRFSDSHLDLPGNSPYICFHPGMQLCKISQDDFAVLNAEITTEELWDACKECRRTKHQA